MKKALFLITIFLLEFSCSMQTTKIGSSMNLLGKVNSLKQEVYKCDINDIANSDKYIFQSSKYWELNNLGDLKYRELVNLDSKNKKNINSLYYFYDANNRQIRIEQKLNNKYISETITEYEGRNKKSDFSNMVNPKNRNSYIINYNYLNDFLISKHMYFKHNYNWINSTLFEYFEDGKIKRKIEKNLLSKTVHSYKYNQKGKEKIVNITTIAKDSTEYHIRTKIINKRKKGKIEHNVFGKTKNRNKKSKYYFEKSIKNEFNDIAKTTFFRIDSSGFANFNNESKEFIHEKSYDLKYKIDNKGNWTERISIDSDYEEAIIFKREITYFK